MLQESFGDFLTKARIRKDVKMRESQGLFTDIFNHAPYSRCAIDYEQLIKELY
jgi:cellulose biosynthesis protein BcsQ